MKYFEHVGEIFSCKPWCSSPSPLLAILLAGLDMKLTLLFAKREYLLETWNMTLKIFVELIAYDSMSDLGEIRVYQRADFQSGSRVLKKVF